jgi:hypothetical protein
MNIPLTSAASDSSSSSSSSSSKRQKRRQLAQSCQLRLQELGYHGLAFTHTAYTGRLHATKDDADVALPWDDLLFPPPVSSEKEEEDDNGVTTARRTSFGRRDKRTGMQIYRRLNIIIEESSDISRLLLHSYATTAADTTTTTTTTTTTNIKSVQQILQKYDIVSIQPMNELVMQSICDLLSNNSYTAQHSTQHNQFQQPHEGKVMMNKNFSNNNNNYNNNNIHYIDIIVLEYATGSKGGYGLPYKLRKEYIHQILLQQHNNIIFEINYATAMVDNKRRHGLIRTLLDIHIGYDSIQKKHNNDSSGLSNFSNDNKRKNNKRGRRSKKRSTGIDTTTTKIKLFPYIISSGSRQDYTTGSDEGLVTFRTPNDVNYYIQNLIGNSNFSCCAKGGPSGNASVERMLTHAYNRVMGVVTVITSSSTYNKRLRGETTRSYVVFDRCDTVTTTAAAAADDIDDDEEEEEDEEEEGNNGTVSSSLIDWLSSSTQPPCNRTRKNKTDGTTPSTNPISHRSTSNSDDAIILPTAAMEENVESSNGRVKDDDDIEDGYIAM